MLDLSKTSIQNIKQIQWLELQKQLLYLQRNSKFYQRKFKEFDIDVTKIATYEDLRRIPITSKEDLQRFNEEFVCVPKTEIIDFVTTSGTLGKPVNLALNEHDLERLALNEMGSFELIGVKKEDVVQITTTLDRRFMAGMAYFLGLRKLGAGVVRTGSGLPQLQWDSVERFQPKYLVAVPSFLLKMIEYAIEHKIDYKNSKLKAAVCIGEPIRNLDNTLNALGTKIAELWDIELFSTYASTEMATAFTECELHSGNHIQPDLIVAEILDEAGDPVKEGEPGELVITTLQNQTMPLLRFATGDILAYSEKPCGCGRNTLRLSALIGRKGQMIKLKGTSVYPQSIIEVLHEFDVIKNFVIEAKKGVTDVDEVIVKIPDSVSTDHLLLLKDAFKSKILVTPKIEQVPEAAINDLKFQKDAVKAKVFLDYR
ncbi:MAG: phenylacetate--CoA ligase family protein [Bacteroidota bacterium]